MSFGYDIKTIFDLGKIRDDFIITKKMVMYIVKIEMRQVNVFIIKI